MLNLKTLLKKIETKIETTRPINKDSVVNFHVNPSQKRQERTKTDKNVATINSLKDFFEIVKNL